MKKNNFSAFLMLLIVLLLIKPISGSPWWTCIPILILCGMFLKYKNWQLNYFLIGFLSGFTIWAGVNVYFDWVYSGNIFTNLAGLLMLPKIVVFIVSGIIGGLLCGLAFYTGKCVYNEKVLHSLDEKME